MKKLSVLVLLFLVGFVFMGMAAKPKDPKVACYQRPWAECKNASVYEADGTLCKWWLNQGTCERTVCQNKIYSECKSQFPDKIIF